MLRGTQKWAVISATAGMLTYYCEWLELIHPGICNQGLAFTLSRIYVLPLLLAAIVGYGFPTRALVCWLFLMLPSWIVRSAQMASSAMDGSNLAMPVLLIDTVHLALTAFVAWGAARVRIARDRLT
jgi:hypothetical protein